MATRNEDLGFWVSVLTGIITGVTAIATFVWRPFDLLFKRVEKLEREVLVQGETMKHLSAMDEKLDRIVDELFRRNK